MRAQGAESPAGAGRQHSGVINRRAAGTLNSRCSITLCPLPPHMTSRIHGRRAASGDGWAGRSAGGPPRARCGRWLRVVRVGRRFSRRPHRRADEAEAHDEIARSQSRRKDGASVVQWCRGHCRRTACQLFESPATVANTCRVREASHAPHVLYAASAERPFSLSYRAGERRW
ncbi:hypothetical protein MRB53_040305 [Persea americana]|nr:hypothetical protein MRB53_040305 [Persea americana]